MTLACFKSYDIRGKLGSELNTEIAYRIGRAFAQVMRPKSVFVGYDARETSPELSASVIEGLRAEGVEVHDIGLCGTEEVYFATGAANADGGIMVTASHNPIDYNGMKLVGKGARPIDPAGEFAQIHKIADAGFGESDQPEGPYSFTDTRPAFAAHVCDFVDSDTLRPLKVLLNAGNGSAAQGCDAILEELANRGAQLDVVRQFWDPDGTFPNGIPNPLLPENRSVTADAVVAAGADLGVAWDGDFDRCFFFDENGTFIDGEYVVALLAQSFLESEAGATIVHDPRVVWATQDTVEKRGGKAVATKVGHAFMKTAMRAGNAVYGGEMSAHHYFRDFFFCDSGMVPWLKIVELMSRTGMTLSQLVSDLQARFPSSGEINFKVADPQHEIAQMIEKLGPSAKDIDRMDGVTFTFDRWRMNLRASNTEPLLRLNIETHGDRELLDAKVREMRAILVKSD